MKVITGRFGGAKSYVGRLPIYGVYYVRDWDLDGERAKEVSLHWLFEGAVDAAVVEERKGLWCVVVRFDHSEPGRPGLMD